MSAKDRYMYYYSLASHEGVASETSTSEEDWRRLKDNFADAATCLDVKKVTYYMYVGFHITFHFMGMKNSTKACIILKV